MNAAASTEVLVLDVAPARCALPRDAVRAVHPVPRLWRPPGLAEPLAGFADLGGRAVPVLRLRRLLDPASPADAEVPFYAHLVVTGPDDRPVALLVDRAQGLLSVPRSALLPVAEAESLHGCIAAEIETAEGLVHLLDPGRLLIAEERERLGALGRMAQERRADWGLAG